jgi:uncharacterized protein (DUF58 family)
MTTPTPRLLWLAALLGVPLAGLFALVPGTGVLVMGVALVAAATVTGAGVFAARHALQDVEVILPGTARLTVGREGRVPVRLSRAGSPIRVEVAIAWPVAIEPSQHTYRVTLGSAESVLVEWPCTPRARGRYTLDSVYLRTHVLLGIWQTRKRVETACELRVYPNLIQEKTSLAAIFLNHGALGIHAQRQVGKGKEFEKLREYLPGDSYEDIDWKATAKRAYPVTKEFQIERTQEIYVIIDASRLSGRPVFDGGRTISGDSQAPTTQLERFITAALVLGLVAEKQGDLFGLGVFSDDVQTFVRAKTGHAHHRSLRDALYTLEPRRVNPDFSEVCTFLRLRLRQRALLLFLTNLDDDVLAEAFMRDVQIIAKQHIVLANTMNLPGLKPLFSGERVERIEDVYGHLAGHLQWHKLRQHQQALQKLGIGLGILDNATLCTQLVSQYMNIKRRQVL